MRELTFDEVYSLGVDLSMVLICKKIRKLANLDRIELDTSTHKSGLNRHLISYLDYCGVDELQFIKDYLCNLQPFMIKEKAEQEKKENFLCVIDNMYKVSLYIKLDTTKGEEVVVSFHEDNKNGIAKSNHLIRFRNPVEYVAVFANTCTGYSEESGVASINVLIQRGLKVLPINLAARKYGQVFVVRKVDIETVFLEYCNTYLSDLYTSDLNLDINQIELFTVLQQISFTSYGRSVFDTLSILIDSLCIQKDMISKTTADFAIVEYTQTIKLTTEDKQELLDTLKERYKVSSIKAMPDILSRVEIALQCKEVK